MNLTPEQLRLLGAAEAEIARFQMKRLERKLRRGGIIYTKK